MRLKRISTVKIGISYIQYRLWLVLLILIVFYYMTVGAAGFFALGVVANSIKAMKATPPQLIHAQ